MESKVKANTKDISDMREEFEAQMKHIMRRTSDLATSVKLLEVSYFDEETKNTGSPKKTNVKQNSISQDI